ncbi:uncharacterized protein OCT59_029007 [Rhizophagus irregularis]|uniref:uncharacterized protein n=1 Tax=Rhizophagus irregularis TaxID=588596 RepID=UPI0033176AA3|nr:hypothetical protein OCT59_029007 [Rhizophagus irregularis]
MTPGFKKTLRDEVVQIINNLGSRISFDISQTFSDQKKSINKKLLPAVKAAMNPSIEVYDTEIVNVIKQLHKSRRDIWKITQDGKLDTHSRRQHMTSRRDQKMTRRKRGLQHMINTKDKVLNDCKPQEITWDEYMKDCEKIVVISELHSDEWSSEDENLANNEKNLEKRPERLDKSNSVIKIHEKKWKSTRIRRILSRADEIGESIGTGLIRMCHRLDNVIDNKSRPTEKMPDWWISSTWAPVSEDSEDSEDSNESYNEGGDNNDDNNNNNDNNNNDDNNNNNDNNNNDDNNDDDNNDEDDNNNNSANNNNNEFDDNNNNNNNNNNNPLVVL